MIMVLKACINCANLLDDGSCRLHRYMTNGNCPDFEVAGRIRKAV